MKTSHNNKITVVATGRLSSTTDCPKSKEFTVYFNGKIVDYVSANTKKFALELAIEREQSYMQ